MTPVGFPQANAVFGPPPGFAEQQVAPVYAFKSETRSGSCDGTMMVVTAWKPDERELQRLSAGEPIFLTVLGGLPAHMLTTSFEEATHPS